MLCLHRSVRAERVRGEAHALRGRTSVEYDVEEQRWHDELLRSKKLPLERRGGRVSWGNPHGSGSSLCAACLQRACVAGVFENLTWLLLRLTAAARVAGKVALHVFTGGGVGEEKARCDGGPGASNRQEQCEAGSLPRRLLTRRRRMDPHALCCMQTRSTSFY